VELAFEAPEKGFGQDKFSRGPLLLIITVALKSFSNGIEQSDHLNGSARRHQALQALDDGQAALLDFLRARFEHEERELETLLSLRGHRPGAKVRKA
jgi:hypothetical protein